LIEATPKGMFGVKVNPGGRVPDVMVRDGVGVPELEISMPPL
jgi:hypothetical protein